MRVRPFDSDRFLVDIARGDIFAASGQILVIGRPKGLQAPGYRLEDPALWEPTDFPGHPTRRIQRCSPINLTWTTLYSFPYNPKPRARLPEGRDDMAALHYYLTRNELELFLVQALRRSQVHGDATLGLVPFSWRKPEIVAHAMADALAGLFSCARHKPEPKTLTVVIRSLDEPGEMLRVFNRAYFREWRGRLGWSREARDVWFPG